jgi:hypothetical protein
LQGNELRFLETCQERVNDEKPQHAIKDRDAAAKAVGKWDNVEEIIVLVPTASSLGHWLRTNLLRLSPAKRNMWKEKVVPVDG